jgi:hypothetical protein
MVLRSDFHFQLTEGFLKLLRARVAADQLTACSDCNLSYLKWNNKCAFVAQVLCVCCASIVRLM